MMRRTPHANSGTREDEHYEILAAKKSQPTRYYITEVNCPNKKNGVFKKT